MKHIDFFVDGWQLAVFEERYGGGKLAFIGYSESSVERAISTMTGGDDEALSSTDNYYGHPLFPHGRGKTVEEAIRNLNLHLDELVDRFGRNILLREIMGEFEADFALQSKPDRKFSRIEHGEDFKKTLEELTKKYPRKENPDHVLRASKGEFNNLDVAKTTRQAHEIRDISLPVISFFNDVDALSTPIVSAESIGLSEDADYGNPEELKKTAFMHAWIDPLTYVRGAFKDGRRFVAIGTDLGPVAAIEHYDKIDNSWDKTTSYFLTAKVLANEAVGIAYLQDLSEKYVYHSGDFMRAVFGFKKSIDEYRTLSPHDSIAHRIRFVTNIHEVISHTLANKK